jgi:hypothetical protein
MASAINLTTRQTAAGTTVATVERMNMMKLSEIYLEHTNIAEGDIIHTVRSRGEWFWYVQPSGIEQDAALIMACRYDRLNGPFTTEEEVNAAVSGLNGHQQG